MLQLTDDQWLLVDLPNSLREEGEIDERQSFIDATFSPAKSAREDVGWSRRGKAVKILAIVDRGSLPLAGSAPAANHHEVRCAPLRFDMYMLEVKPENLSGDKAFPTSRLDADLEKKDSVAIIASCSSNRRLVTTQDGTSLCCHARRLIVEHFFAWLEGKHRLLIRSQYYAANFFGFVQLGCITMLLKRF